MSQADTGGPAFPAFGVNCVRVEPDGTSEWEPQQISEGMSTRDWFAGQALQGLIATDRQFTHSIPAVARLAYDYADDMLAARRKP